MTKIKRQDIVKRVYDGKDCVEFSLKLGFTRELVLDFKFTKMVEVDPDKFWKVETVIPAVGAFGPVVVLDTFMVFKPDQPLEFIAEVGLRKLNATVFQVMTDMMAINSGISELLGVPVDQV